MSEFRHQHKGISAEVNARIDEFQASLPEKYVSIIGLAESFGINVYRADLPAEISGAIYKEGDQYVICSNKREPKARRRFTYAHELAHYLLHRADIGNGINENTLFRGSLSNDKEIEANKLAADILMPMPMIDKLVAAERHSIVEIAHIFGVSVSALLVRLGIPEGHVFDKREI